ncbi:MAG: sulfate adenylyltransferase [Candidatus Helarchaeota archaeon]
MSIRVPNAPHGGKLVNRIVKPESLTEEYLKEIESLPNIQIDFRAISDLEMIAIGAYSPLEGFMESEDYYAVLNDMRLANGLIWSIPITLAVTEEEAKSLKEGEDVLLLNENNEKVGILHLREKFHYEKKIEAKKIYKTTETAHPGVNILYQKGNICLGGKIDLFKLPSHEGFQKYYLKPAESRVLFVEKEWTTVVGFQTRNPLHRAHEYLLKCALEIFDGIFLHPLVGATKNDDIPATLRMACYEVLIKKYFPKDRVILGINPAAMRYAGPREAIFHALIRKNYGCTHIIIGRDHAGVGNYYNPHEAQAIFNNFTGNELGIIPLFFENIFFCRACSTMASKKTCPHPEENWLIFSGSKVRKLLKEGNTIPCEYMRPEVAQILADYLTKENKNVS